MSQIHRCTICVGTFLGGPHKLPDNEALIVNLLQSSLTFLKVKKIRTSLPLPISQAGKTHRFAFTVILAPSRSHRKSTWGIACYWWHEAHTNGTELLGFVDQIESTIGQSSKWVKSFVRFHHLSALKQLVFTENFPEVAAVRLACCQWRSPRLERIDSLRDFHLVILHRVTPINPWVKLRSLYGNMRLNAWSCVSWNSHSAVS